MAKWVHAYPSGSTYKKDPSTGEVYRLEYYFAGYKKMMDA